MKGLSKFSAGLFLAAALTGSAAVSRPAHASSEGRKNTAIALGAAAVHQLLNGKTTNAVVAGAGAAAAYKRYKDAKKDEGRNGRRRTSTNDRDWFDRLTGKNKNDDNVRWRNETSRRDRDDVQWRNDRRNDRVSRRNDRARDRYEDDLYSERYDDTYNDRYDTRYDD
jgi:hypothetical protein